MAKEKDTDFVLITMKILFYCVAGAASKTVHTVEKRRLAEKECRRSSIKQLLRRIGGPSRDLDLRLFATVSAFSCAGSGSGEPPDRVKSVRRCVKPFHPRFFSEPIFELPKVNLRHRNRKTNVKKVDRTRTETSNRAKLGPGTKPRQKSAWIVPWNPN